MQGLEGRDLGVKDLLTEYGNTMRRYPWIMGPPVFSDQAYVERKEDETALELLKNNHVVLIMGGFRTGKTSMAAGMMGKLKGELEKSGKNVIQFSQIPWKISALEKNFESEEYTGKEILVIQPYEVTWDTGVEAGAVNRLRELKEQGNYLVLECNGNVREPGKGEKEEQTKQMIRELVGDSMVTIGIATDRQVLEAIRSGVDPVFSPQIEEWLVKEAGGNLLWAKMLANNLYESIKHTYTPTNYQEQKDNGIKRLLSRLRKKENKMIMAEWVDIVAGAKKGLFENAGNLGNNVVSMIKRGIDPLQWTCPEGVDIEYYRQTIPNGSKLFNEWIQESMPELQRVAMEAS